VPPEGLKAGLSHLRRIFSGAPMSDFWNERTERILREEHAKGKSAGKISKAFASEHGLMVSRNAVSSKLGRLNGTSAGTKGSYKTRPDPLRVTTSTAVALPGAQSAAPLLGPTGDCRWPFGDPGDENFRFCGATTLPGKSYCECHQRMAHQPVQRRLPRIGYKTTP
jgi:hypothetical protein